MRHSGLRVNQSGMIDVFGKNSTVTFNGGSETLKLPQTLHHRCAQINSNGDRGKYHKSLESHDYRTRRNQSSPPGNVEYNVYGK